MSTRLEKIGDKFWNNKFWDNRFWEELSKQKVLLNGMIIIASGWFIGNLLPVIQDKNDPTGIFNLPVAIHYLFIGAGVMYMICKTFNNRNDDWL